MTWGLALALGGVVALVLAAALLWLAQGLPVEGDPFAIPLVSASFILASVSVGALILARHPGHRVGQILVAVALLDASSQAAGQYARYAIVHSPGSLPAGEWMAWFASWAWFTPLILVLVALPLTFPSGRLPSPRWRLVLWLAVVAAGLTSVGTALGDAPLEALPALDNPIGILAQPIQDALFLPSFLMLFAAIAASATSLVLRLRRSRGEARQQVKWFVYAIALLAPSFVVSSLLYQQDRETPLLPVALVVVAYTGVPVAIGVAILRHRLFDIDVVINRTLVYAALSVTLASVYIALVIVLQGLLSGFAGGGSLAVAASTLTVAAAFQPLRRRIQAAVDRRFYRSRYDAQRTLEAFSVRLRHEVDLLRLTDELRDGRRRPSTRDGIGVAAPAHFVTMRGRPHRMMGRTEPDVS